MMDSDKLTRHDGAGRLLSASRVLIAVAVVFLIGCRPDAPSTEEETRRLAFEGRTMGTYYAVQVTGLWTEADRKRFQQATEEELEAVNQRMSTYIDTSELSLFNKFDQSTPWTTSPELLQVVAVAQDIGRRSQGAYDVTLGPLIEAWGFGVGGDAVEGEVPQSTIDALLQKVGDEYLEVDLTASTLSKAYPGLRVELSSIAKGYAVDRVAERLTALGATDHWVEVGGEVRAAGQNPKGRTWLLGIERPELRPGQVQRLLPLADASVATSGDYRNYREIDGERYSHILDARTGRPVGHRLASVSVVHAECMIADAWSTALLVMGEEEGMRVAEEEGLAALFLIRDGKDFVERSTSAFETLTAP